MKEGKSYSQKVGNEVLGDFYLQDLLDQEGDVPKQAVSLRNRDRKSTRLNSSHSRASRMPSSA